MHILTHNELMGGGYMCKNEPQKAKPDIDDMIYGDAVTVPSER